MTKDGHASVSGRCKEFFHSLMNSFQTIPNPYVLHTADLFPMTPERIRDHPDFLRLPEPRPNYPKLNDHHIYHRSTRLIFASVIQVLLHRYGHLIEPYTSSSSSLLIAFGM